MSAAAAAANPIPLKRKASSPDSQSGAESDASMDDEKVHPSLMSSSNRSGAELVSSTKPGEPPVTKRTLQNRKAQREFRKRREARVKDLEERCRRFDQMGLEANGELQQVARRFKDENEALRGLLIRLGYGGLIQQALDGLHTGKNNMSNSNDAGMYEDNMNHAYGQSAQWPPQGHLPPQQPAHVQGQQQQQQPNLPPAPPGSINTTSLDGSDRTRVRQGHAENSDMNAPWSAGPEASTFAGQDDPWATVDGSHQQDSTSRRSRSATTGNERGRQASQSSSQRDRQERGRNVTENPLLALNLGGHDAQQAPENDNSIHGGDARANGNINPPASGTLTPGTFNSLMGILGAEQQPQQQPQQAQQQQQQQQPLPQQGSPSQPQSGGGSAFLRNAVHNNMGMPFASAHRPHQNDALLNPNPIPFALNLSNEPEPEQSWWDRHGGGMFGGDSYLDEKANAVAQAQSVHRNGSQSPFDISAFLTTGTTPGGNNGGAGANGFSSMPTGFTPALTSNNVNDPLSQAGADLLKNSNNSGNSGKEKHNGDSNGSPFGQQQMQRQASQHGSAALNPADHVQTFLRLLERRAIRAGEQSSGQRSSARHHQEDRREKIPEGHLQRPTPWMDMGSDAASDEESSSNRSNSLGQNSGDQVPTRSTFANRGERPPQEGDRKPSRSGSGTMITPNNAYSRLAQHPIFLRTDAGELEAMINTIQSTRIATVTAQGSSSGAPLELDASAVDVMLGMLDRKQRSGEPLANS
ncbi:unnamed protein product [Sympodiomycopsis kandeliae]